MAKGLAVTIIDSNPAHIERGGAFVMKVYYCDVNRLDLLRAAGAAEARALLFCQDGNRLTKARLEPILDAFPQAAVFVRAFDRKHIMDLDGLDLAGIYREVFESAVIMGRAALGRFDLSDAEVLPYGRASGRERVCQYV